MRINLLRTARRAQSTLLLAVALVGSLSLTGCGVGASAGSGGTAAAAQAVTVSPSFFGMNVQSSTLQPVVPVGARSIAGASFTWASLEPAPGTFAWSALDAQIRVAQSQGIPVMLVLGGAVPAWEAAGNSVSPDLADWDDFVASVTSRYGSSIAAYQVWGSATAPNTAADTAAAAGTASSPALLAVLAVHAAAAIHAVNPSALIVSPSLDADSLQSFLGAGGAAAIDVIGVSLDAAGTTPEAMAQELADLRTVAAASGVSSLPLWNEQSAWQLPSTALDPSTQAAWLARALILNAGSGIARMDWFAWDNAAAGTLLLLDANGAPTPAATAYGIVEGWLSGATLDGCAAAPSGLWTCSLLKDGAQAWILWSPNGTVQASALGMTMATDISGATHPLVNGSTVTVSAAPLLLH